MGPRTEGRVVNKTLSQHALKRVMLRLGRFLFYFGVLALRRARACARLRQASASCHQSRRLWRVLEADVVLLIVTYGCTRVCAWVVCVGLKIKQCSCSSMTCSLSVLAGPGSSAMHGGPRLRLGGGEGSGGRGCVEGVPRAMVTVSLLVALANLKVLLTTAERAMSAVASAANAKSLEGTVGSASSCS